MKHLKLLVEYTIVHLAAEVNIDTERAEILLRQGSATSISSLDAKGTSPLG